MSGASERTSEWPSTLIWVFGLSGPQCVCASIRPSVQEQQLKKTNKKQNTNNNNNNNNQNNNNNNQNNNNNNVNNNNVNNNNNFSFWSTAKTEAAIGKADSLGVVNCTSAIARKANRVLQVANQEAENSEDPAFVERVQKAYSQLRESEWKIFN